MIRGRFGNTSGRPYVNGWLLLPRFKLWTNLSFLVDTGADVSALMPADALKIGLDYQALVNPAVVGGIGGEADCFKEAALLAFDEPNRSLIHYYSITIMIPEFLPALMKTPSILGRDVLDRWRMSYDPGKSGLKFTVRSADLTRKTP